MIQNKTKSYLLYAFGEVFLVVIGILIALQVNNWNEERRIVNQKNELLQNVNTELTKDLNQLQAVINDIRGKNGNGVYLMSFFESEKEVSEFDLTRLRLGFMNTNDVSEFFPSQLAYKELVSTGSVNRIEDDTLKELLFDHYETSLREKSEYDQRERYGVFVTDGRFKYMDNNILLEKVNALTKQGDWKEDPFEELNPDWNLMRAEGEFPMYLSRLIAIQQMVIYDLDETKSKIDEMMVRIRKERGY